MRVGRGRGARRSGIGLLLAAGACLLLAARGPAPAGVTPGADGGELLYVCNQDDASVAIIDLESLEIVRTVDLTRFGFSENARPHHIAVEPDGSHWYVSLIGEGVVAKFDRADRLVDTAPFETPGMLALDANRGMLYVGRSMTAVNPPTRIGAVRTADMSIDEIEVFVPRAHAMVLDDETGIVYTASLAVNQIAAVDPELERAFLTEVEGPPHALMQFALSPDGQRLAISGEVSHQVLFFELTTDPQRPRHVASVEVGSQPFDPVFTRDGSTLWLGNKAENTIAAIDAATHEVVVVLDDARIRQPHGAAVSTDGRWVLVSSTNVREPHPMMHPDEHQHARPAERVVGGPGSVAVIDARTRELVDIVEVGRNATGIAVGPR